MTKNKTDKNEIIDDIFSYTSILNNKVLYKADPLDEKFDELASIINTETTPTNKIGEISSQDIRYVYIKEIDKIPMKELKGELKDQEYGKGNELSTSAKQSIKQSLDKIAPETHTVTLSIKNYIGTYELKPAAIENISFTHNATEKLLEIAISVNGYFDFNTESNAEPMKFSSINTAVSILQIIFTYLSFFKDSIWVGDSFSYDQELAFKVVDEKTNKEKTIKTYNDDVILILYPCHVRYEYRDLKIEDINSNFIQLISNQTHLLLAFKWFARAARTSDSDNRIIMLCIAFEALYGKHNSSKEETKNKDTYMLKIVYFISKSNAEREKLSTTLVNLFKERNAIVHADIKKKSEIQTSKLFHESKNIFIRTFLKELTMYIKD